MDTKLTLKLDKKSEDIRISPFVQSMSSGVSLPADLDYKAEYSHYITKKYKFICYGKLSFN